MIQRYVRSIMYPLFAEQQALRQELSILVDEVKSERCRNANLFHDIMTSILHTRWLHQPDYLASRMEIGHWLNFLGLSGEGVEVGVFKGGFSSHLLRTWDCRRIYSIDPWKEFRADDYIDVCNLSSADHEENFNQTTELLKVFGNRSQILRATSSEGAEHFTEQSLDFVYLDAQHHYESIKNDIELWYPKVKPGGVLGGHDYLDGQISSGVYGVKQAVAEFVNRTGFQLVITKEASYPSWFVKIS